MSHSILTIFLTPGFSYFHFLNVLVFLHVFLMFFFFFFFLYPGCFALCSDVETSSFSRIYYHTLKDGSVRKGNSKLIKIQELELNELPYSRPFSIYSRVLFIFQIFLIFFSELLFS
ncbi:hypothetical protein Pfo_003031 [Paulownia fortunei]|nr:hypothetical protein Pfo_003031 [Paulownia fortunei]